MNFDQELQSILQHIPGSQTVMLMGVDGIPVAQAQIQDQGVASEEFQVECSRLVKDVSTLCVQGQLGDMQTLTMTSDYYHVVCTALSSEYFLLLLMDQQALLGRGKYRLQQRVPALRQALL